MKIQAISSHETALIIRQLAARGKWSATRLGAQVEFARMKTAAGNAIQYAVTIARHQVVHARAVTVADAVDQVNSIIARHVPAQEFTAGRVVDPRRTGTPHLVRRARHEPADAGSAILPGCA